VESSKYLCDDLQIISIFSEQLQKLEQQFKVTEMSPNAKMLKDSLQRYKDEAYTKDGQPLYFTRDNVTRIYGKFGERRIDHWMDLQRTLTAEQVSGYLKFMILFHDLVGSFKHYRHGHNVSASVGNDLWAEFSVQRHTGSEPPQTSYEERNTGTN
jgi:hypothetical protein